MLLLFRMPRSSPRHPAAFTLCHPTHRPARPSPPAVLAVAAAVLAAHLWLAKRGRSWAHLGVYALARLWIYAFFGISAAVLTGSGAATMHLHHLYLGWALAIWAEFSHWASGLLLAVGAGVLVQGAGAYSFAPIFTPSQPACFSTGMVDYVSCTFWDRLGEPTFNLKVCATTLDGGQLPAASCALRNGTHL